jgi:hypothetical protein
MEVGRTAKIMFLQRRNYNVASSALVIAFALTGGGGITAFARHAEGPPAAQPLDHRAGFAGKMAEQFRAKALLANAGDHLSSTAKAPQPESTRVWQAQADEAPQKRDPTKDQKNDLTLGIVSVPSWMNNTTPSVNSPQWNREQDETAKEERQIQRAIDGICHGC